MPWATLVNHPHRLFCDEEFNSYKRFWCCKMLEPVHLFLLVLLILLIVSFLLLLIAIVSSSVILMYVCEVLLCDVLLCDV